ncbi:class II fructose-bisphosphate aldolase [Pectinatus brassicae]|uniref:Fructose-bisphosphate aldolase class II/tagatose 1,6-diphosphate aldolase GatY/KbaY n=1 Tax=Pectinatus brassicae TaxID=862415 RepID=A0A840ULB5_9FIRM|nr:class II fructose-bisphosphate aldolase [Pectinatus brassicae]MBB5335032.1 fructose-bisphosphate aldolase class II/tagatose 1,6-diphosphate aldolase GatY/KbaY [Pectinatus brassicae]
MLVNSKEILQKAKNGNYGVVAPDFIDLDSARTFVQVAEKLNTPILLSFAEAHKHVITLEEAAVIGKMVAKQVNVPIALHLDHGTNINYLKDAIKLGFSSVMIDASMYDLTENIRITKEIVALAHANNVTVEAEIGHVGGNEENPSAAQAEDSIYTTVEEAREFVKHTNIDSLAVSIGTAHGVYKNNKNPVLNFERLHELAAAITIPLVLHGSSGTGEENLKRCVNEGISKVNIFTDFLVSAMKEIKENPAKDYLELKKSANLGMEKMLTYYINLLSK